MNKSRKLIKRILFKGIAAGALVSLAATPISMLRPVRMYAEEMQIFDTSKCITLSEFEERYGVKPATLFIGTYIIPLSQYTDELKSHAETSMSASAQSQRYYKSELAGGNSWFDIESASGLSDITEKGIPVEQEAVDKLYVQYYVDDEGNVKEAVSGQTVSIYDLPDPYNMTEIPELQTLYNTYITQFDKDQSKGIDKYYFEALDAFFDPENNGNLRNEDTNRIDRAMTGLNALYNTYKDAGNTEYADAVKQIIGMLDAERRSVVYDILCNGSGAENVTSLLEELDKINQNLWDDETHPNSTSYDYWCLQNHIYTRDEVEQYYSDPDNLKRTKNILEAKHDVDDEDNLDWRAPNFSNLWEFMKIDYYGGTADKQPFQANQGVQDAISNAIKDCQTAYDENINKTMSDSGTVLGTAQFTRVEDIVKSAETGATPDNLVKEFISITNIANNGEPKDSENELQLLDDELIKKASDNYEKALTAGNNEKIRALLMKASTTDTMLENAIQDQQTQLDEYKSELEFLISARKKRTTTKRSFDYCAERINWTEERKKAVVKDEFEAPAITNATAHQKFLGDMLQQLVKEDESLQSKLDELKQQLSDLYDQYQEAVNSNNTTEQKRLLSQIDALKKAISREEEIQQKKMESGDASAAERIMAQNNLEGSEAAAIKNIVDKAMEKMAAGGDASGELSSLYEMEALAELSDIAQQTGNASAQNLVDQLVKEEEQKKQEEEQKKQLQEKINNALNGKATDDTTGDMGEGNTGLTPEELQAQKEMEAAVAAQKQAMLAEALNKLSIGEDATAELNALYELGAAAELARVAESTGNEMARVLTNKLVQELEQQRLDNLQSGGTSGTGETGTGGTGAGGTGAGGTGTGGTGTGGTGTGGTGAGGTGAGGTETGGTGTGGTGAGGTGTGGTGTGGTGAGGTGTGGTGAGGTGAGGTGTGGTGAGGTGTGGSQMEIEAAKLIEKKAVKAEALDKMLRGQDATAELNALYDMGAAAQLASIAESTGHAYAQSLTYKLVQEQEKEKAKADQTGNAAGMGTGADGTGAGESGEAGTGGADGAEGADGTGEAGAGGTGGAGTDGTGTGIDLESLNPLESVEEIENAILAMLGKSFDKLGGDDQAVVISALDKYYELTQYSVVKDILSGYVKQAANKNNYIFETMINEKTTYGSLKAVATASGYRYLYKSKNMTEAELTRRNKVYRFARNDINYKGWDGKTTEMDYVASYKNNIIYISEKTIKDLFKCDLNPVETSKVTVILNSKMSTKEQDLLDTFLGKAEE